MNKINVLFVMLQLEMGGSERLVYDLARKLDRGRFNPSIAWFFGNGAMREFQDLNVPLFHVPKTGRFDFSALRRLAGIVREYDIDVVNAHHFMPMVYSFTGCKVMNRSSLFYTEHSAWELERVPAKWQAIGRRLLSRADGVIGVSAAVTRQLKEKFNTDKSRTHLIPNGVDLEIFEKDDERQTLRGELGLTDAVRVIGIVANFRKIKNHLFLLRAFREVLREYANVKLLLVGQGFGNDPENSEREIRQFISDNGLGRQVLMLGYRPDVPRVLGVMDIACLTSVKEGLPISLIEAMAAGLPIVGTDVEGIRDVVLPGRNGFLVPLGDAGRLKEALLALLNSESLRRILGRESRGLARDAYSLDSCVRGYQDLFISAAAGS